MMHARELHDTTPATALEEAREALQRALLFGTDTDVREAHLRIDAALDRQAEVDRVEQAPFIDGLLAELPDPAHLVDESMIEKAAQGGVLYSELVQAFRSDPTSVGLTPQELAFASEDPRRLRALILARRDGIALHALESVVLGVEDSRQKDYALAARSDTAFTAASLEEWVAQYVSGLSAKDPDRS
jgi:hypothetical protein